MSKKRASLRRSPRLSTANRAVDMRVRRLVAAAFAACLGLMLGSCSAFPDFVADHWPHFAGGEPNGLPPRPGDPGYAQFIAHGQPSESANSVAGSVPAPASGRSAAIAQQKPAAAAQGPNAFAGPAPQDGRPDPRLAPAADRPGDSSAVAGGLY